METTGFELFYAEVRDANSEGIVKEITIDYKVVNAMGLKKGDKIKCWIKKIISEE